MQSINITTAREDIYNVTMETIKSHEPIIINTKHGSVIMMSLEDYESMQETIHILKHKPNILNDINKMQDKKEKFCKREELEW